MARKQKKFTLLKISLTPNHPIGEGYILIAVDDKYNEVLPAEELCKVAAKFYGFTYKELKVTKVTRLGLMLGWTSLNSYAVATSMGQATIHVLDYANGEY